MLELVTYYDPCKRVSHRSEICAIKERRLLQDQVQLGIGANVLLCVGILGWVRAMIRFILLVIA